jgi:hypothetical protein
LIASVAPSAFVNALLLVTILSTLNSPPLFKMAPSIAPPDAFTVPVFVRPPLSVAPAALAKVPVLLIPPSTMPPVRLLNVLAFT